MQRLIGLIILLAAGIGAYFCVTSVLWQDRAIRHFVEVPATILRTEVRSHSGKSTTYSPEATYSYTYQGQTHQGTRVLAVSYSTSNRSWAQSVVNRIAKSGGPRGPEGGWQSVAYVDPEQPDQAILIRDYLFLPYALGMGTLTAATLGLGMLVGVIGFGRSKMAAVPLDDSGWQLLLPTLQLRKQLRNAAVCFFGFSAAIVVLPAHWTLVARQYDLAAFIGWLLAAGVMTLVGVLVYRRWSVCHHISDARLRIRPAPARRGEPLALAVGIDALVPLRVTSLKAHVVCTEHYKEQRGNKTSYGTRTYTDKTMELSRVEIVAAGQEVDGSGELTLDRDLPETSDTVVKQYPYYTWEIRLKLELEGMVDYAATFPLEVA